MADLEVEPAVPRNDVERGAAADDADMRRRVRDIVSVVAPRTVAKLSRALADVVHDCARNLDRVDATRRERRMRFVAANAAAPAHLAFVRDDQLHPGRLADDAPGRLPALGDDIGDEAPHADAADLLVIGQREMQWARES